MSQVNRNSENTGEQVRGLFAAGLKKSLKIDPRYSVLDFQYSGKFLEIFVNSIENATRVSGYYRRAAHDGRYSQNGQFRIKVVLLPDKSVGGGSIGVCHVGVAPVRNSAASSSEQITQVLYGESFDLLQVVGEWTRARLHADGYIGWVSSNQVTSFSTSDFVNYQSLATAFAAERILPLFEKPKASSHQVREAVFGSPLKLIGKDSNFLAVRLPDGGTGYAGKAGVSLFSPVKEFSSKKLIDTALRFQGVSYVWGGRSSKGFDCSGFIQTVFRLNGLELPRDAVDQFSAGKFLGKEFKGMRPGDLLFFSSNGDKINHVALYLGRNRKFIHSSGFVRINSLDPGEKSFSKRLFAEFVGACRVII